MRWERRPRTAAGFSLTELLTVLAIMSAFLLIAIPNIVGIHENYLVRSNASGLMAYLKLGRMKAVANNRTYIAHLDPPAAIANQCRGSSGRHLIAVYRDAAVVDAKVEQCYIVSRGINVQLAGPGKPKASFRANGMCEDKPTDDKKAPNWWYIQSRNGRICQLICVNAMGAVNFNPSYVISASGACSDNSYNATTSTPCPPPA